MSAAIDTSGDNSALLSGGELVGGRYRVERCLGGGGMATVYRAMHEGLDQPVAIKVVSPATRELPGIVARSMREARAATRLKGALAEVHGLGIVHRDLKPANLFITRCSDGLPCLKLIDFGISRVDTPISPKDAIGLTNPDVVMGSPRYMPPEQMESAAACDARSDIWGMGAILYEVLMGESPTLTNAAVAPAEPPVPAPIPSSSPSASASASADTKPSAPEPTPPVWRQPPKRVGDQLFEDRK